MTDETDEDYEPIHVEVIRKQALEEAYKWMLARHEAQKHRDNYMLIEANRFKKEMLK